MASIICKEDSWFMLLDREGFNQIQGSYTQHLLNEKVYFLKSFEMFKGVAVNKMLSFLHEMKEQTYLRGQAIYLQGSRAEELYFLMEGEAEIVQEQKELGVSRMINQKYDKCFRNTKQNYQYKQVVRLSGKNYLGDEDMFSDESVHSYSAYCVSQSAIILSVSLKSLSSFLKIYDIFPLLKTTAQNKREHYLNMLSQDITHPNQTVIHPAISLTSRGDASPPPLNNPSSPGIRLETVPNPPSAIKLELSEKSAKCVAKFDNVYTKVSLNNIRSKNYHNVLGKYQSTQMFTIEDVPMTTKMNYNEDNLRRIKFRLKNSLGLSMKESTRTNMDHTHYNSKIVERIAKLQSDNTSYEILPMISPISQSKASQNGSSLHNSNFNSSRMDLQQHSNFNFPQSSKMLQIINLSPVSSIQAREGSETYDKRKKHMYNQQLSQALSAHDHLLMGFKHFTEHTQEKPNKCQKQFTETLISMKSNCHSPRDYCKTFCSRHSFLDRKPSIQGNIYQENLIKRRKFTNSIFS